MGASLGRSAAMPQVRDWMLLSLSLTLSLSLSLTLTLTQVLVGS